MSYEHLKYFLLKLKHCICIVVTDSRKNIYVLKREILDLYKILNIISSRMRKMVSHIGTIVLAVLLHNNVVDIEVGPT